MFNQILVAVDLSTEKVTKKLCQTANDMAEKYQGEITLMTVIPDYGMPIVASFFPEDAQKKLRLEVQEKLQALAKIHFKVPTSIQLKQGKPRKVILKTIEEQKPDLVMIGCRLKNSENAQAFLGATGTAVSDRASCSVMIVR